jgi:hypothetical protein
MRELNNGKRFLLLREWMTRQPRRPALMSDHWISWARTLGMRYLRIAIRHHGLSMVLAQRRAAMQSRIEHWQQGALTICPKINLTIRQLLPLNRNTIATSFLFRAPAEVQPVNTERVSQTWLTPAKEPLFIRGSASTESHLTTARIFDTGPGPNLRAEKAGASFRGYALDSQSPLTRVFARFQYPDGGQPLTGSRFETALIRHSLEFVKQIREERTRVEDLAHRPLLTVQQREPVNAVRRVEETVFQSPRELKLSAADQAALLAGTRFNIEQLTDQVVRRIDDRLVAHQERLGKVF